MKLFRRKKRISGYKTSVTKADKIGVYTKYMSNNFRGGGHHWSDHFSRIKYLFLGR